MPIHAGLTRYILALDQGTTSSRAIVFDQGGNVVSLAQQEFPQIYPSPGHVEHDPEQIWSSQLQVGREALAKAGLGGGQIAAVGIANQRETTVLWERDSGRPVANAIVWQSRISSHICDRMKAEGREEFIHARTGLVLDPYFSASKVQYLLKTVSGLRARALRGEILFGTIDSFLIWRLTGGRRHVTDPSNASRTLLFNIHTLAWDEELLATFDIPRAMLPEVVPSSEACGESSPELFGAAIPIAGIAGDQQAALFGQMCLEPGMAKNTYGTGCFLLLNTGSKPVAAANGLLTTVGWKLKGEVTYCLEGAVFIGGAVVQWIRDGLRAITASADIERLAASVPDAGGVCFVPAFVGLGAPYWDPYARGVIVGIKRETTVAHIARAALDAIAFQSRDVLDLMNAQTSQPLSGLRVDGGAAVNSQLMQFQADILGVSVRRPRVTETTALGAAYLAGLAVGYWTSARQIAGNWALEREFQPSISAEARQELYSRWRDAVARARGWETPRSAAPAQA